MDSTFHSSRWSPRPPARGRRLGTFGLAFALLTLVGARAADLLPVTPAMLSGPLDFIHTPAGTIFAEPVPYGLANNLNDSGWVWPRDDSGRLNADFGAFMVLSRFRVFCTYNDAGRGATWTPMAAWQLHRADLDAGMVLAFRCKECPYPVLQIGLRGLKTDKPYVVEFIDEERRTQRQSLKGQALASDFELRLPRRQTSLLVRYRPE
jgi:hypothetical protein